MTTLQWTEVIKNLVESLAVLGALWVLHTWKRAREDRAADILLKLEKCFGNKEVRIAREWVAMDEHYANLKVALQAAMDLGVCSTKQDELRANVDELLRFYVVLMGFVAANQVPRKALKACYRFWLTHYYNPDRKELRQYVDMYYPTLRQWLKDDEALDQADRFCTPREFPWGKAGDVPTQAITDQPRRWWSFVRRLQRFRDRATVRTRVN